MTGLRSLEAEKSKIFETVFLGPIWSAWFCFSQREPIGIANLEGENAPAHSLMAAQRERQSKNNRKDAADGKRVNFSHRATFRLYSPIPEHILVCFTSNFQSSSSLDARRTELVCRVQRNDS